MEKAICVAKGIGEYGIDTSRRSGRYYIRFYDGSEYIVGFSRKAEADDLFDSLVRIAKRKAAGIPFTTGVPGEYDSPAVEFEYDSYIQKLRKQA